MRNTKAKSFNQERFPPAIDPASFKQLCKKIAARESLAANLPQLSTASLPQILKCIELANTSYNFKPSRLRAVFFVPLNNLIAEKGVAFALEATATLLGKLEHTLAPKATVHFKIDSWAAATPFEALLETLMIIQHNSPTSLHLTILPPNATELELLWQASKKPLEKFFTAEFFEHLQMLNITTVHGKNERKVLEIAAVHKLKIAIHSDLSQDTHIEDFCAMMLRLHHSPLCNSFSSWTPDLASATAIDCTTALRAIAISRLLFSDIDYICAPLLLIDPQLAQLAPLFGANDFGYAGIDQHSATSLNIPTLSEAEKITGITLANPAVCTYSAFNG